MITVAILGGGYMGASHTANYARGDGRVRVKTVASRVSVRASAAAGSEGADLSPEIHYFVECVEQGRASEQGTGEQARLALALSLAAARSLETGRPEDVGR